MDMRNREEIFKLRLQGLGYKAIASKLKLSRDSVCQYCHRNGLSGYGKAAMLNLQQMLDDEIICKYCGAKLKHTTGKRRKKFCSDRCRKKYWKMKNKCEVKDND